MSKVEQGRFDPRGYAIDRATRIFIVYWPALAITWLLDSAGQRWFGQSGLWDCRHTLMCSRFAPGFIQNLNVATLGTNLAMLQDFFGSYLGSNKSLWTLSYEFWFYVVFAFFACARQSSKVRAFVWIAIAVSVIAVLGHRFVLLGGLWMLGVLAARYRGRPPRSLWPAVMAFALTTLGMRIVHLEDNRRLIDVLIIYANGMSFVWLMIALRDRKMKPLQRIQSINASLAGFSYTLYLVHFPLMLFVISVIAKIVPMPHFHSGYRVTSPIGAGLYSATMVIVLLGSWALARVTEGNTKSVRTWIRRYSGVTRWSREVPSRVAPIADAGTP